MIRRNVQTEARLIDDLLDVSRLTQGKMSIARQPTDVHAAVHEVIETLDAEVQAKRIIGFDPASAHRLFEAFEQGTETPERYGGLGLALAICKGIMTMHAGTIAATVTAATVTRGQDRCERCPQLVAEAGDELVLGRDRFLRRLLRLRQPARAFRPAGALRSRMGLPLRHSARCRASTS
jgi:hypothetical protein